MQEDYTELENYVPGCLPVKVEDVTIGSFVLLYGFPCKPGKTGSPKALIQGNDIWTSKRYDEVYRLSKIIMSPIINIQQYQLIDINQDNYVTLLLPDSSLKQDIKLDNNQQFLSLVKKSLLQQKQISVVATKALGVEKITKVMIKQQSK